MLEATRGCAMSTGHEHRSRGKTGGRGRGRTHPEDEQALMASESQERLLCHDPTGLLPEPSPVPCLSQSQPGGEQHWDGTPKHRCLGTTRGRPAAPSPDSEPSLLPPLTGHLIPQSLAGAPSQLLLTDAELPTGLCPVFIKTAVTTPTVSNTASLNKLQMK